MELIGMGLCQKKLVQLMLWKFHQQIVHCLISIFEELCHAINPLAQSHCYGIDIFSETVNFVNNHLRGSYNLSQIVMCPHVYIRVATINVKLSYNISLLEKIQQYEHF